MDSIEPGQDPSVMEDMDAVAFAGSSGDAEANFCRLGAGNPPPRIEGRFCPFCNGPIPEEFIFCTHCGRDV
jgi:hypothetical protein